MQNLTNTNSNEKQADPSTQPAPETSQPQSYPSMPQFTYNTYYYSNFNSCLLLSTFSNMQDYFGYITNSLHYTTLGYQKKVS
jgi:hypothetical protein